MKWRLSDEQKSMLLSAFANGIALCCESTVVNDVTRSTPLREAIWSYAYDELTCDFETDFGHQVDYYLDKLFERLAR